MPGKRTLAFLLLIALFFGNIYAQNLPATTSYLVMDKLVNNHSVWVDYDNDADLDFFRTDIRNKNNQLYQNKGNGFLQLDSLSPLSKEGGNSFGAAWADIDNDRDLDAYVYNVFGQKNYLYRNNGDGTFTKLKENLASVNEGNSFASAFCDFDNDGDQDLLVLNTELWNVANSIKKNILYINDGKGDFRPSGIDLSSPNRDSRGCAWGDYDNDGWMDLFIANFGSKNMLFRNTGTGRFERVLSTDITKGTFDSNAAEWADIDNDGDLDLYVVNAKQANVLYMNNGNSTFNTMTNSPILDNLNISGGVNWGDVNNDGFLDLFGNAVDKGVNSLYMNTGSANSRINIKLRGSDSNTFGVGTRLKIKAIINGEIVWQERQVMTRSGKPQVNVFDIHFGLGDAKMIDSLVVFWPSGLVQEFNKLKINNYITIEEAKGYYIISVEKLEKTKETKLNDLSVSLAADNIQTGNVHSISIFYQNNGIANTYATIKLDVPVYLVFNNSIPAYTRFSGNTYEWIIKDLKAGESGVITLAFKVPEDASLIGKELITKSLIFPINFDENKYDNTFLLVRKVID